MIILIFNIFSKSKQLYNEYLIQYNQVEYDIKITAYIDEFQWEQLSKQWMSHRQNREIAHKMLGLKLCRQFMTKVQTCDSM